MGAGIGCRLLVDGQRFADGCTDDPDDTPAAMSGLQVTWGRETTVDQPEPSTCTFEISDPEGGVSFVDVLRVGRRIDVQAVGTLYPDPTTPVWPDPGFEDGTAATATINATAGVVTDRAHTGTRSLRLDPTDPARRAGAIIAPAPFAAPGDNPAAWDHIPTTAAGQQWRYGASIFATAGALVRVRPVLFTGPWTSSARVVNEPLFITGDDTWQQVAADFTPTTPGAWVGLEVTSYPTGPRWTDLDPALRWIDLATGPSIEYDWTDTPGLSESTETAGGVLTRTNLCRNPRMSVSAGVWSSVTGTPVERVPDDRGGWAARITSSTARCDMQQQLPATVTALDPFRITLDTRAGDASLTTLRIMLFDSTDNTVSGAANLPYAPDGQWQRLTVNVTPTKQFNRIYVGWTGAGAAGRVGDITDVMFGAPDPYFDGDTPDVPGGADPWRWLDYGAVFVDDVTVLAPGDGLEQTVLVFSGRVTDLESSWPEDEPAPVVQVTAADFTADLENRQIGDEPWAVETVAARFARVLALAGGGITADLDPGLSGYLVTWRDVDAQAAAGLLVELAASVDGVLWSATHQTTGPYFVLEDPGRRPSLYVLAEQDGLVVIVPATDVDEGILQLSACDVLRDEVTWTADVSDLATRAAVTWLEQGVDENNQPTTTERTVIRVNTPAEVEHGSRRLSLTTQLQAQADALAIADRLLARTSDLDWRASGLTIDDADLDDAGPADTQLLLTLLDGTARNGRAMQLVDLPTWAPAGDRAGVNLEGGTYTFDEGAWVLDLTVSNYGGQGRSARWNDLDPAWTWADFDPSITWTDLRGVGVEGA